MSALKAIAALLTYPEEELLREAPAILDTLKKQGAEEAAALAPLVAYMDKVEDILDMQEEYVALFDRTPSLSLHLFEHVYGDARERGQAMVDLVQTYEAQGLEMASSETPDYLPMFLEYLSLLEEKEAANCLGEVVDILAILGGRLQKRGSPYAGLFDALVAMSSRTPNPEVVKKGLASASGKPITPREVDASWEEPEAFEPGNPAGSCPSARPVPPQNQEQVKVVFEEKTS